MPRYISALSVQVEAVACVHEDNWPGACGSCRELQVRDWEGPRRKDTETPRLQVALALSPPHVNGNPQLRRAQCGRDAGSVKYV